MSFWTDLRDTSGGGGLTSSAAEKALGSISPATANEALQNIKNLPIADALQVSMDEGGPTVVGTPIKIGNFTVIPQGTAVPQYATDPLSGQYVSGYKPQLTGYQVVGKGMFTGQDNVPHQSQDTYSFDASGAPAGVERNVDLGGANHAVLSYDASGKLANQRSYNDSGGFGNFLKTAALIGGAAFLGPELLAGLGGEAAAGGLTLGGADLTTGLMSASELGGGGLTAGQLAATGAGASTGAGVISGGGGLTAGTTGLGGGLTAGTTGFGGTLGSTLGGAGGLTAGELAAAGGGAALGAGAITGGTGLTAGANALGGTLGSTLGGTTAGTLAGTAGGTLAGSALGSTLANAAGGAAGGLAASNLLVPGAIAASGLLGAAASTKAAETAASSTERAAQISADAQKAMLERQIELQQPWRQAGINALAQMQGQTGAMPAAFTGQVDLTQDPGYAFRLSEGMKALERSAAARGGLLSGGTLKGIQRFGQDLASQEYQNAYNRALTEYNARVQRESTGYNRLASLAGVGQTATGQLTGQMGQTAANLGNLYYNAGQTAGASRASGYLGTTNALTGALGTGLNYLQNQQLLSRFPLPGSNVPVTDYSVPYTPG